MKTYYLRRLHNQDGKGVLGCMVMIVLLGAALYLGIVLVPIYYANFNFESQVKTEVSRAGAHFLDDKTVVKNIMSLARKNEIRLTKEDISTDRFAGQLHVRIEYAVPVDFIIFERDLTFKIDTSSFIGAL